MRENIRLRQPEASDAHDFIVTLPQGYDSADQILVVEGGRLAERGRHQEIVARQGRYQRLYERQYDLHA